MCAPGAAEVAKENLLTQNEVAAGCVNVRQLFGHGEEF
jgi:hypothetical protein